MMTWEKLEQTRLALQTRLDSEKTAIERNRMGQFATPTELAREIVEYGVNQLSQRSNIRFLDPGIGTGSFYSALRSIHTKQQIEFARGFEVDPHYGHPAKDLWKDTSLEIFMGDFTKQEAEKNNFANLIICNPPYVRHHHIDKETKAGLQVRTEKSCGVRINGLSGLYCYFMGLSHSWMEEGAIAGWLIPSEFMDVNYGRQIKQYILSKVTLLHIHRFDPVDAQFDDALVSSAVVWFRNDAPPENHHVKFSFGGTLASPSLVRDVPVSELKDEQKWTRYPIANEASKRGSVTLGDLFSIKRGIATGDNKFFIMTRGEIEERELPFECFTPVLPSTRYIKGNEIKADSEGMPLIEKQLFLLDTKLSEQEIKDQYPVLWNYLQSGKRGEKSVSSRYLCRTRRPWYAQENRPAAPIVCTYMGRKKEGRKPFQFILNHSKATACNVYLLLYPKEKFARTLDRYPSMKRAVWKFLNSIDSDELIGHGRVYGGGLHKLEPKELRAVSADHLVSSLPDGSWIHSGQDDLFEMAAAE